MTVRRQRRRSVVLAAAFAVVAIALGACGSGPITVSATTITSPYRCDRPQASPMTTINVMALPIVSNGALFAGDKQGFFRKHGLELRTQQVQSVPATSSALQGGGADFAFTATLNLLQAADNGLDVLAVAPFAGIEPGYYEKMKAGVPGYQTEISALLVRSDSPITDPGQLDGKTVAITDVKAQSDLATRTVIADHGGNPDSVEFVQMSPPDSYNALLAGKVDAAYTFAPYLDNRDQDGARVISWAGVEALHDGPTSMFVASGRYAAENPDTVIRFNCALREAAAFGNEHPDEIRRATALQQKSDPARFAKATVPYFYTTTDMAGIARYQDLMLRFGFLYDPVDLNSIIIPAARDDNSL